MKLIDRVIDKFGAEDHEQYAAVQYLEQLQPLYNLKFTSIPNSTYTKSPMQRLKNTLLGLRPGLGDLFVVYPSVWILSVEMKRAKTKEARGTLSPAQREWIAAISSVPNCEAVKCDGFIEFVAVLKGLLPDCPDPHPLIVPVPPRVKRRSLSVGNQKGAPTTTISPANDALFF